MSKVTDPVVTAVISAPRMPELPGQKYVLSAQEHERLLNLLQKNYVYYRPKVGFWSSTLISLLAENYNMLRGQGSGIFIKGGNHNPFYLSRAKLHATKLIEIIPQEIEGWHLLGLIALKNNEIQEAKGHFATCLCLAPSDPKTKELQALLKKATTPSEKKALTGRSS